MVLLTKLSCHNILRGDKYKITVYIWIFTDNILNIANPLERSLLTNFHYTGSNKNSLLSVIFIQVQVYVRRYLENYSQHLSTSF